MLSALEHLANLLWGPWTFFALLGMGVVFTLVTRFSQWTALVHGTAVLMGRYEREDSPGAISHFQALSAALSGTVGLGNIGGVALAIGVGGPGALFWMWVVGFFGMAIKTVEVTLALMFRNTDDPRKPAGGAMWVAVRAMEGWSPRWQQVGRWLGAFFCGTMLVSTITGGNIFQSWNVAEMLQTNFGIGQMYTSAALAVIVGLVIVGGIQRIGQVAGLLVPLMVVLYVSASLVVLVMHAADIPACLALVVRSAFTPNEAAGAFLGAGVWFGFEVGLKRALFSNEAGQGSAPIAHSAARTDEPAREGVIGGLEPFIDTLVICTLTALVILVTHTWDRPPTGEMPTEAAIVVVAEEGEAAADTVQVVLQGAGSVQTAPDAGWQNQDRVFAVVRMQSPDGETATHAAIRGRVTGASADEPSLREVTWEPLAIRRDALTGSPQLRDGGVFRELDGAPLTGLAYDSVFPGLGKWLISIAALLFAISTMISWSYYGEQGIHFLVGNRGVLPYKLVFLLAAAFAPWIAQSRDALLVITDLGTGLMLWGNIPILLLFSGLAVRHFNAYIRRWRAGEFEPGPS